MYMMTLFNISILFFILIVLSYLYRKMQDKLNQQETIGNEDFIQKYLFQKYSLNQPLGQVKKPILWIHIPYEYNSRHWISFGSRSSFELNQPYLYLCVKSIIKHCKDSFHICLIDDHSFVKLIPDFNISMKNLSTPLLEKIRSLCLLKLLYLYGGILVPISFVCFQDLLPNLPTDGKPFIFENRNKNVTSTLYNFCPDIHFMGCLSTKNEVIEAFEKYAGELVSQDFTAESKFLGTMSEWVLKKIEKKQIILIPADKIGVKNIEDKPILIEDLLNSKPIELKRDAIGIYIPSQEILSRTTYSWFAYLSSKEILESDLAISPYLFLSNVDESFSKKEKPNWVGFWKTPLIDLYGLKPNHLGDNLLKDTYPNY